MRFLFISPQYLPTIGGVERYTQNLAAALSEAGHEVTVAASALPEVPREQRGGDGVLVLRMPARLFMAGRFPAPRKNGEFREMARRLFAREYDLAVINTRFYPLSLWAARQCGARGQRAIVLEHGTAHLSPGGPLAGALAHVYEHAAMRCMRRSCGDFYGVSAACCGWLSHFGVKARGVLYNAVNPAALEEAARRGGDIRGQLGIEAGAPLVVYSGRLVREKGIYELLEGFALLRGENRGAVLVLAGGGAELEAVRRRGDAGVLAAGPLSHERNMALLAAADAMCLPSYSEGFPTTVLEAAALGTAVAATPVGGITEIIADGETGLLLGDLRPGTVALALRRLLAGDGFGRRCGQAARGAVRARFTWDRTAAELVRIAGGGARA